MVVRCFSVVVVVAAVARRASAAGAPGGPAAVAGSPVPAVAPAAAELLRVLDADHDGRASRLEFLRSMPRATGTPRLDELGFAVGSWEELFLLMDRDADGQVDASEAEQGLRAALAHHFAPDSTVSLTLSLEGLRGALATKRQEALREAEMEGKLRSRAEAGQVGARRLDDSADNKVRDPRCEAPKGFPTRPEGFVCLNSTALIYCSRGRRWKQEESCGWKGSCQAGLVPEGGCDYPLCHRLQDEGSYCHQDTVFKCQSREANGRTEVQSVFGGPCPVGASCRAWEDGPPPSRRRRTQTCAQNLFLEWLCVDDPPPPPYAACVEPRTFV